MLVYKEATIFSAHIFDYLLTDGTLEKHLGTAAMQSGLLTLKTTFNCKHFPVERPTLERVSRNVSIQSIAILMLFKTAL